MPEEGLKSLADVPLGWRPWRWMARSRAHAELLAQQNAERRIASLEPFLEDYSDEQRDDLRQSVRGSLRTFYCTGTWLDVLDNRMRLVAASVIVSVVPAAATVALIIGPPLGWLSRGGAVALAITLTTAFFGAILLTPEGGFSSEFRFFGTLIPPVLVTSALATAPTWWRGTPWWLAKDWVHYGLAATAWCLSSVAFVCMVFWLIYRASNILIPATMRRRHPEQHLVNSLSYLVHELPFADDPRQAFLKETEDGAQTIEFFWPRRLRTRYPHLNADMSRLARQIGAATREQQLNVSIGAIDPIELRKWLTDLLVAVVARDLDTFRRFADYVSVSATKMVWWRRIGRGTVAFGLLFFTLALLVTAIWQPGLPNWLKAHGQVGLGEALMLNDEFRLALAGGAVAALRALVALYSSATTGQTEASGFTTFSGSRRKR